VLIQCALRPDTHDGENSGDKIRVFSSNINDGADGTEKVFSSKVNDGTDGTESSDYHPKSVEKKFFEMRNEARANTAGHSEQRELHTANSFTFLNELDPANSIMDRSAYDDFLEHIDLQLRSLEYETEQFMSSKLVEEVDNEKQINGKWNRITDILKLVKETRER
jgi:hypothetical protein